MFGPRRALILRTTVERGSLDKDSEDKRGKEQWMNPRRVATSREDSPRKRHGNEILLANLTLSAFIAP
jgi:hypothetical protein